MVSVDILIENNPGVSYLSLTVVNRNEGITLVDVVNGVLIEDMDKGVNLIFSADSDATEDVKLVTLFFRMDETVELGDYPVTVLCREAFNQKNKAVSFAVIDGSIGVVDFQYGDANGDGAIDGRDVLLLRQYLAGYNYDTGVSTVACSAGADANGDGTVNGLDLLLMRRYMANYNYDTGKSTVVLGPPA